MYECARACVGMSIHISASKLVVIKISKAGYNNLNEFVKSFMRLSIKLQRRKLRHPITNVGCPKVMDNPAKFSAKRTRGLDDMENDFSKAARSSAFNFFLTDSTSPYPL